MSTDQYIHIVSNLKDLFGAKHKKPSILCVFAHPDDETLLSGGLFQAAKQERIPCQLVTVTRGELGGRYSGVYGEKLAQIRAGELRKVAKTLNIPKLIHLSLPDKGVFRNREVLSQQLSAIITTLKPTVVITHDLTDATQHIDHIATAETVIAVCKTTKNNSNPSVYYASTTAPRHQVSVALNIRSYVPKKLVALKAYVSQGLLESRLSKIPLDILWQMRYYEYYIPAQKTDHKRSHTD